MNLESAVIGMQLDIQEAIIRQVNRLLVFLVFRHWFWFFDGLFVQKYSESQNKMVDFASNFFFNQPAKSTIFNQQKNG